MKKEAQQTAIGVKTREDASHPKRMNAESVQILQTGLRVNAGSIAHGVEEVSALKKVTAPNAVH